MSARCETCGATATPKVEGTVPKAWFCKYLGPGKSALYCSEVCLRKAHPCARACAVKWSRADGS